MEESLDSGIQHASLGNENENTVIHEEANTSTGNETQIEGLVKDITTMFAISQPPFSITGRINVPNHLRNRKVAEEIYTPQVISIGPIHHSTEKLRPMEKCKVRYLECFINRAKTDLKNLVSAITEMEKNIRRWYAETIVSSMSSDDFVKMILMDAIFILERFFRDADRHKEHDDPIRAEEDDPIMAEPWLPVFVRADLMLLENQLPFFVLKKLFDLSFPDDSNSLSLIGLSFKFFVAYNFQRVAPKDVDVNVEILHLTDLIRITFLLHSPSPGRNIKATKLLFSATQLQEAGVKFNVSKKKSVLYIKFDSKKGVLEMPSLGGIHEETIVLFRNLIALEQSRHIKNAYMKICEDLNAFYEKSWHRWKATLRNQYFSSPWRSASTIAAIILLVLTFIQTVFSIIQVVAPK